MVYVFYRQSSPVQEGVAMEEEPAILTPQAGGTSLQDLPFGSVIQIPSTDTYMCNDTSNCTATTTTVLPYKFVKMQARTSTGATYSPSDKSYWVMLDNYCWWGSSNCQYYDGTRRSRYASWNASTFSDYSSNISVPKTYNFLNTLVNFYNSLPSTIGGVSKDTAIPTYNWEMVPVPYITGTPTKSSCISGWSAGSASFNGTSITFNSDCTYTYKVSLPSYDEWQGGLYGYGDYTGTTNSGAGGAFCSARFGVDCTNNGTYYLFSDTSATSGFPTVSSSNPRPYYPWLRTPDVMYTNFAWFVEGYSSSSSVSTYGSGSGNGVSPSIWFSSTICTPDSGNGSYALPLSLTPCDTTPPTCTAWSPATSPWKQSGSQSFTITGCSDDSSGLNPSNNYTCVTGGNHGDTCNVTIYDNAGNSQTYYSPANNVDTTPPYLTGVTCNGIDCRTTLYFNTNDVTVSYTGVGDSQSGFSHINYWLYGPIDPSPRITQLAATSISYTSLPEGSYTAHGIAVDNVGNLYNFSDDYPGYFIIDTTPPALSATNSGTIQPSTPITLSVSDTLSGLPSGAVRYAWDVNTLDGTCSTGGSNILDSAVITNGTDFAGSLPAGDGAHTLYLCAKDSAGNVATWSGSYELVTISVQSDQTTINLPIDLAISSSATAANALTVKTNNPLGYTITLSIAKQSDSCANTTTALKHTTHSTASIPTTVNLWVANGLADTPLQINTWGFNLNNSNTNFMAIPACDNPRTIKTSTSATQPTGENTTVTYGARVDMSLPAGDYTNTVVYTVESR
ncbi:MAG: hypothetical protein LBQ02_02910 [Candidatus Nomurabacteria bacterium]|jgi:hypothetical protein|nr:hypothetical protein [Candidatus Nomurabacteria bacterium]